MLDLSEIFSSRATTKILQTLNQQQSAIPLRHIAYLSGLPLFSVQRALKQLVQKKIIKRKNKNNYSLFTLNPSHPCYVFLSKIFVLENQYKIHAKSKSFNKIAQNVILFCADAGYLLNQAKKV